MGLDVGWQISLERPGLVLTASMMSFSQRKVRLGCKSLCLRGSSGSEGGGYFGGCGTKTFSGLVILTQTGVRCLVTCLKALFD